MIPKFLLNLFLSNNVYLGYSKNFRNASMLYDIKALAVNKIELHDLNHTIGAARRLLLQFQSIWSKYGNTWIVLSRLGKAIRYGNKFLFKNKKYFSPSNYNTIITLWQKNWVAGLLTNKMAFQRDPDFKYFPAAVYYLNYTFNQSRLNEAQNLKVLQTGLADTNANFSLYQYGINANEKTTQSYMFLFRLVLLASCTHIRYSHKSFLLDNEESQEGSKENAKKIF